jgi:hypothetical protein
MQAAIGVTAPFPGFVPTGRSQGPSLAAATTGPRASSKSANDAVLINAGSAIIDGEVVVPSADGTTDFCRQLSILRD